MTAAQSLLWPVLDFDRGMLVAQRVSTLVLLAGLATALPGFGGRAHACGGFECFPGTFFPASGTVPANLKGIYWRPSHSWDDDGGVEGGQGVRIARVDGATPVLLAFTLEDAPSELGDGFLIVPDAPFVAGARYVAWDLGCDDLDASEPPPAPVAIDYEGPYPYLSNFEGSVARFSAAEAAPLPTALGELAVSAQRDDSVLVYESAGCTQSIDVIARDVELVLSSSASPWADALFYETAIEGETFEPQEGAQFDPYPGTAMAGRGQELVRTQCDIDYPQGAVVGRGGETIAPGTHRVELIARIPGESLLLRSDEARVALTCPAPIVDAGDDAEVSDDAQVGDGDGSIDEAPRDGGSMFVPHYEPDGGGDASESSTGSDSSDGCSCRAASARGSSNGYVIGLALLALYGRRRMIR